MNSVRRDPFQAIADPNRRAIIELIIGRELTLNQVAENFKISRPAISKHIRVLSESGLVTIRQDGRERYCRARVERLRVIADWLEPYRKFWEEAFDRLDDYLREPRRK